MKFSLIIVLFVFIAILITIIPNIFGGLEAQRNITAGSVNNTHPNEYNAFVAITQTDLAVIAVCGSLLVLAMLFILARVFL